MIRVQMPSPWLPYLQTVLKQSSSTDAEWQAVTDNNAEYQMRLEGAAGASDTTVSTGSNACKFPLASVAAVVRVDSPLLDFPSLDALLQDKQDKITLVISQELQSLLPSSITLPALKADTHEGILSQVLKSARVVGLVRWQTAAPDKPWPSGLRPLRMSGKYPGHDSALTFTGVVEPAKGAQVSAAQTQQLCAALTTWGTPPVEILAGGDINFDRGIQTEVQKSGNYKFPFEKIIDMLPDADLRVANLECLISDQGKPWLKAFNFRADPAWAMQSLKYGNINVLTMANNHTYDYGPDALVDTVNRLRAAGISVVGAGKDITEARTPAIVERNGYKIAFLGYVDTPNEMWNFWPKKVMPAEANKPGVAWGFPENMVEDIRAARQKADIVIVMLHSGVEEKSEPSLIQKQLARAAIDAGANMVLGSHPHVLQGVEYYQGKFIAYSLGNFVFDMNDTYQALMRVWVGPEGVRAYAWEPFRIAFAGQPIPANNSERQDILQEVNDQTRWLNPKR